MNLQKPVHVLLGAYSGARYVRAQIESIRAQTHRNWTLLVRDDGSADGTRAIVEDLSSADARVQLVPGGRENLGCVGNFSALAHVALERNARYVMFADQDDVWYPNKIEKTLAGMLAAERRQGDEVPILIHTDLEVISVEGRRLHASFMRLQKIRHEADDALRVLLVQNFVTGCTVMMNRPLLELGTPVPAGVLMHDWWFALCAAACGVVEFVPAQTMGYRRHGENTVTVRGYWRTMNPLRTNWRRLWRSGKRDHVRSVYQVEVLSDRLWERDCGDEETKQAIRRFLELHGTPMSGARRVGRALSLGLRSQTVSRTAVLYLRLLTWSAAERAEVTMSSTRRRPVENGAPAAH